MAVFNDTNTNTFCWQCGDTNPLNDFHAVLSFSDLSGEAWTDLFYAVRRVHGFPRHHNGLSWTRCELFASRQIECLGCLRARKFVRPSVSDGIIPGRILGVDDGLAVVLECCDGRVGGVDFLQAFFPSSPFIVPPGGLQRHAAIELHFAEQIASPVPEPTSLLLLGSAVAAGALRRRQPNARSLADLWNWRLIRTMAWGITPGCGHRRSVDPDRRVGPDRIAPRGV